jgi:hypothetical protein
MTATEKWDDPFFFELCPEHKLVWIYLLDKCNHAGVIEFNEKMASFIIGFNVSKDSILNAFSAKIKVLESGKWFIKKFIDFQYGELTETNNTHKSVINILKKEGAYEGLNSPLQGDKDKDKDKDKEKDKDNTGEIELNNCLEIALKDESWVRLNKTSKAELEIFNKKLLAEGIYYKLPIDYKTHFSRWKKKDPQELKTQKTFIYK